MHCAQANLERHFMHMHYAPFSQNTTKIFIEFHYGSLTTTARLEKKFLLCKIVQQLKLKNPFGHLQRRRRRKRRQRRRRRSETISRQKIPHPIKISPAETGLSAGNGSACEFQL